MTNIALESVVTARESLVLIMQEGLTPKDIRSGGSKVGQIDKLITKLRNTQEAIAGDSKALDDSIELLFKLEADFQELPWNSKAKAESLLDQAVTGLTELEDKAESEEVQASSRLPELEAEITESLRVSAGALIRVGHLLNEAREEFENANDFLAWSRERFEFKKAYVYRLMKVADEFKEDDALAGQSINVLHKLAGMPEEVKQQARQKVEEGETLTGKEVERLNPDYQEAPEKAPESPESAGADESTAIDLGQDEGAPWSPETGREVSPGSVPTAVPEDKDPEILHLRELVSELQAELAATRQERENKGKSKATVPALPQFSSDCLYARLGLSYEQSQDPAEVRKAFRDLVKAGYNSQHESYKNLVEAKDALMQDESKAA